MAKNKESNGGLVKVVVGFLVTLLVLVIVFAALVKYDVAGLGTKVFGPMLKDVPIISMILPVMPEEEVTGDETSAYNFETVDEAVEILKLTEKMLMEKEQEAENISEQLTQLKAEVDRLKVFESNQVQFDADKTEFDTLIATTPDAIVYTDWFAKMYPENAMEIYGEVIQTVVTNEELQTMISIYQNMKAAQAAAVLEEMSITNMDQVATIIKGLTADQAAKIVGLMNPQTASKLTTYMYPE